LKPLLPRHDRFDFVSLNERRDYRWPGGKTLAFLVTTNIEWFAFGAGLGNDPAKPGEPQTHRNYSWRDEYAPQITDAIRKRGDEVIAHGRTNAENLRGLWQPDEERILRGVTDTISRHEGRAPAGWFGAGAYETAHTPDLLQELGYRYLMDWPMDDQPVWMRTRSGRILSIPYPIETDDAQGIIHRRWSAEMFANAVIDQFDEMLRQSDAQPLVMNVSLHPYVFGQPFRVRQLRRALRHCAGRASVWYCRPRDIAEYCYSDREALQ
jgi:allantoinase